jgi:hypothetical protein
MRNGYRGVRRGEEAGGVPRMNTPPISGTKHCRGCGRDCHVLAFAANRSSGDGLAGECRECMNRRAHEYQQKKRFLAKKK